MSKLRRAGLAALLVGPFAAAYRFALVYRVRAGYPRPRPPMMSPADLGLSFETISIDAPGATLAAWFIPARGGAPGPGVVLVHGWESARDRSLPTAQFLNAAGFHCLAIDVRGHGSNAPESLPLSAGEFGADALAGFRVLIERPEVTSGAIAGHSMGGIGAILAAAADPRVAALVSTSAPAEPYRLTRQTFRLAHLPIPDLVAYPLAWLTTRVYLRPRGHAVPAISASAAITRYAGPVLLIHGDEDDVVPVSHLERLARIARASRDDVAGAQPVETLVVRGGRHSWLYEDRGYRAAMARFLTASLGGPLTVDEAEAAAVGVAATRLPERQAPFEAVAAEPGGLRSLVRVVAGATAGRALPDEIVPPIDQAHEPSLRVGPTLPEAAG